MKKLLLFLAVLICVKGFSQISLDFQTPAVLGVVKLSNSQTKFIDESSFEGNSVTHFSLYNLDGSLFKTFQLPSPPHSDARIYGIYWVTTSLFDMDSTTIEYLIAYDWDTISGQSGENFNIRVIREDGTILLDENNAIPRLDENGAAPVIFNSDQGTKLMLQYMYAYGNAPYQTRIFNLQGTLPAVGINDPMLSQGEVNLFPNPNNGSFSIKFSGTEGNRRTIELYGGDGKKIDTFYSSDNLLNINKNGLPDGVYFIRTRSDRGNKTSRMIIDK
ncbi:MAG: T9SS type A sorting domain-containing protein [Bacteroidota bacterium]|nr:T9SS type A sorting domain-containing protein [Bacteroidota bacterium]